MPNNITNFLIILFIIPKEIFEIINSSNVNLYKTCKFCHTFNFWKKIDQPITFNFPNLKSLELPSTSQEEGSKKEERFLGSTYKYKINLKDLPFIYR